MSNVALKRLIMEAYGIAEGRDYALIGPSWLDSERFDIVARHPGDTTREQLQKMLQNLLAERFRLELHRETRQLPTYTLVVAKDGPKLKPGEPGSSRTNSRPGKLEATNITMDRLASAFSRLTGQPVINATGLSGMFTFTLEWAPDETQRLGPVDGPPETGRSLFGALQDQLGLKLEGKKAPTEVLVVDRIERTPTEN